MTFLGGCGHAFAFCNLFNQVERSVKEIVLQNHLTVTMRLVFKKKSNKLLFISRQLPLVYFCNVTLERKGQTRTLTGSSVPHCDFKTFLLKQ